MIQLQGVRSRAPLRLGLAGGGTDLSPFCDEYGGCVMNATVALYAYAHLEPNPAGDIVFEAAELGARFHHKLTATVPLDPATLLHCGVYNRIVRQYNRGEPLAVKVRTTVDVPSGSGLGGSSALTVALISAYCHYLSVPLGEYDIARLAFEIERIDLRLAGGKQDQYAAAFGGFNFMEFYDAGRVIINPLRVNRSTVLELEASLVLCFSGQSRSSAKVIENQQAQVVERIESSIEATLALKQEAVQMKEAILTGRLNDIAGIMRRGWLAKKATSASVSTDEIETILEIAMSNGGLAGKASGAGGGGFLLIIANPSERHRVGEALSKAGRQMLPVGFTQEPVSSWRQQLTSPRVPD